MIINFELFGRDGSDAVGNEYLIDNKTVYCPGWVGSSFRLFLHEIAILSASTQTFLMANNPFHPPQVFYCLY